jgi:hypothetical protein
MPYNKEACCKYKANHPDQYRAMTLLATNKYRTKNIELVRLKDKLHKRFMKEWLSFRNIDLF